MTKRNSSDIMFPTIQLKSERLNAVNVIHVFDEESDEASCAVICIKCEKRFLTKRNSSDIMFPYTNSMLHEM